MNTLSRHTQVRLFVTCWLVFVLHFATNIVREHYPAMSLGDHGTWRVDEYLGLHPDIFELPGRGAYIGNNIGASLIAAIPYWLAKPVIDRVVEAHLLATRKPGQEVTAIYDDPRPNRLRFYRQVRERGLDVKFGLAAFVMQAFTMAPLSAASAVVMFRAFVHLGLRGPTPLGLALLYALGTPIFFRTSVLNNNLMVAHFGFFAFFLLWQPGGASRLQAWQRLAAAGFFAGLALLIDYSGLVVLALTGAYALSRRPDGGSSGSALGRVSWFGAGAAGPIALLMAYQWLSFGHPLYPGQHYMPPVEWIDIGYQGFGWPTRELLWALLFDLRYGLLISSPLLVLALGVPLLLWQKRSIIQARETLLILGYTSAFLVLFSGVQYTRLQWNTGVRYMVPVIPLLFLLAAAVLVRLPRGLAYGIGALAVIQSWSLTMVREGPIESLAKVMLGGFQLPWLTVLRKMAPQYATFLANGASPLPFLLLCAVFIYGIWRIPSPGQPLSPVPTHAAVERSLSIPPPGVGEQTASRPGVIR